MEKYLKINSLSTARLSNPRLLAFYDRTNKLIHVGTPEKLGVAALMTEWDSKRAEMSDYVNEATNAKQSTLLGHLDKRRSSTLRCIFATINAGKLSQDTTKSQASEVLDKVVEMYRSTPNMALDSKTSTINGLILDLGKEENKTHVTALGLTEEVAKLGQFNEQYDKLWIERNNEVKAVPTKRTKTCRRDLNVIYHNIITAACAVHVLSPCEETNAFILSMNALIEATKTTNKQSIAQKKKGSVNNEANPPTDSVADNNVPTGDEEKKEDLPKE